MPAMDTSVPETVAQAPQPTLGVGVAVTTEATVDLHTWACSVRPPEHCKCHFIHYLDNMMHAEMHVHQHRTARHPVLNV